MRTIIVLIIIAAMILPGCQFLPITKEQIAVPDIHAGQKGITLDFLESAPPSEVYEASPFDIIVKVHNQGASNILGGMLVIGVEEQNVDFMGQNDARFDLAGKSIYNPEGVYDMKQFRAFAKKLGPEVAKSYSTTVIATACYAYKTYATSIVCIDSDILGIVKNKPCMTATQSYRAGQGAPIAVTSVLPRMIPHQDSERIMPEFTISITNSGGGEVVADERVYDACMGRKIGQESWNAVKIISSLSDQYLECKPEILKLKPGETKAVCTLPGGISRALGTYTAPISIELTYGYMTREIKAMTITKPVISDYGN